MMKSMNERMNEYELGLKGEMRACAHVCVRKCGCVSVRECVIGCVGECVIVSSYAKESVGV